VLPTYRGSNAHGGSASLSWQESRLKSCETLFFLRFWEGGVAAPAYNSPETIQL